MINQWAKYFIIFQVVAVIIYVAVTWNSEEEVVNVATNTQQIVGNNDNILIKTVIKEIHTTSKVAPKDKTTYNEDVNSIKGYQAVYGYIAKNDYKHLDDSVRTLKDGTPYNILVKEDDSESDEMIPPKTPISAEIDINGEKVYTIVSSRTTTIATLTNDDDGDIEFKIIPFIQDAPASPSLPTSDDSSTPQKKEF